MLDKLKIEALSEKAVQTYGTEHQKVKAIEELGELVQAISRSLIGSDHNVEEEIADVEIVLAQLRHMYCNEKIDKIKEEKMNRLAGLVW